MNQILNKVRDLDLYDVDAAKEALSVFFVNLWKHKDGDCILWLRALESVINRFPKLCGSQRNTIEKFLTHFMDSSSYNTVVEAAKCAHVLQQVRPGQEKTGTPKVCWRDQMSALCNAVHSLISEIFSNAASIYRNTDEQETQGTNSQLQLALNSISVLTGPNNFLNREALLVTRLRNVFVFIQAMLVEIYPVAKPVRPQLVLDVVIRAVGASVSSAQSMEDIATVKQQALRTLDALIACLGSNLIPFSPLIFKCVMQTLRWSSENSNDASNKVRVSAYATLALWLTTLRTQRCAAAGRARCWWDELVQQAARDVTPAVHAVQLTMSNPPRNLSKKQKKKQARLMLQQSSLTSYSPSEANKTTMSTEFNDEVAIAALECIETFLIVCGISLKPATHKILHELLVRECFRLDGYSCAHGLALLRALEAARKSAPPGVPPPTQYCLQLYSSLLNSRHREISKFSSQALLDIRLHLHCSPTTLNFAVEVQTVKEAVDKRKVSRRNREALVSLLGADKIPPETNDVEVVNQEPEEPSSKKPRIEDVSDKISLSSSEASIEVCDSDSEDDVEEVSVTQEINAEIHKSKEDIKVSNIHEAPTQLNLQISNDTIDGTQSPKSMEIVYGNSNTRTERVSLIEKLDDENLPSTNETDDVQITCGQVMKSLEDDSNVACENNDVLECAETENNGNHLIDVVTRIDNDIIEDRIENDAIEEVKENEHQSIVNGFKSPEKNQDEFVEGSVTVKIAANNDSVTVEDMLADFVDEVIDDNLSQV